jgi:hypothetical protein
MKPIWYPLFTLIVVGLALYVAWHSYPWWSEEFEKWFGLVAGLMVTVIVWLASMGAASGLAALIADHSDQIWHVYWRGTMVSLRGSDGVSGSTHGSIFMLSGQIGSEQYYHYYTVGEDGSFVPGKWRAGSGTRVYEEDRKDGEAIRWDTRFKHEWVMWLADRPDDWRMDFHIPKGSLKQNFSLE